MCLGCTCELRVVEGLACAPGKAQALLLLPLSGCAPWRLTQMCSFIIPAHENLVIKLLQGMLSVLRMIGQLPAGEVVVHFSSHVELVQRTQ